MSAIKRITPEEVLAAYEKTRWTVERGRFKGPGDGPAGLCGCAIGVYCEVNGAPLGTDMCSEQALKILGLDDEYASGFMEGFDGRNFQYLGADTTKDLLKDFLLGYEDGKAAWEKVKHLA